MDGRVSFKVPLKGERKTRSKSKEKRVINSKSQEDLIDDYWLGLLKKKQLIQQEKKYQQNDKINILEEEPSR